MTVSAVNTKNNTNNIPKNDLLEKVKDFANVIFAPLFMFADRLSTHNDFEVSHEIPLMHDISDEQITINSQRKKHLTIKNNADYTIKKGDNFSKIAEKYGVEPASILALNGLDEKSALKMQIGQVIKIPPTRTPKNINSLNDVAKAMGVSSDFILKLKRLEDGPSKKDNEFWTSTYDDATGKPSNGKNVKGTETIGIGHVWKKGEPRNLTKKQVLELFTKDLIKIEDHLKVMMGGEKKYDALPQPIKEALLDMVFNKGSDIIKNSDGLLWCLKNGKYEAAIVKMTHNKTAKGSKELSGLSKRRLFDMAMASKMYKGKIPQTVLSAAQQVYNHGVELLKKEHPKNYVSILVGYNNDVKAYWGDKIKVTSTG